MMLSDCELRRRFGSSIEPWADDQLQPASYDVRLGSRFLVPPEQWMTPQGAQPPIDLNDPDDDVFAREEATDGRFVLPALGFALGHTIERVTIGPEHAAVLDGKSSLARKGLLVHLTAGYVDPGWCDGQITLELFNVRRRAIALDVGMLIGQLRVLELSSPVERPYGMAALRSKYSGDGVEPSRYHLNRERRDQP